MKLHPILSAMRHNTAGPILIGVQIAVTVAIVCNALFIINDRFALMARATGVDESSLFAIRNQWIGRPSGIPARVQTDLAALRSLPGVADAYVTNSYPLSGSLYLSPITLHPDDKQSQKMMGVYFGDAHALRTLGLQLIAGRNFSADDVVDYRSGSAGEVPAANGIIVTQALARQLAPGGKVLGHLASIGSLGMSSTAPAPTPIIGVVQALQVAGVDPPAFLHLQSDSAVLLPYRFDQPNSFYVVRARSAAQLSAVMQAATRKLYAISRSRVLQNVQSFTAARQEAYRGDRGQAVMLMAVSAILLAMTGWGIVGLTTCWVNQRRRQIGIRRALGGTRLAIVRYFQTENLLIAGSGIIVGAGLAVAANLWMVSHFAMPRLDGRYLIVGAAILLVLGQLAVLWPALRAASVPPAEATRTV